MSNKSTIRYWLREPGEDSGAEIEILSTVTIKVPEVGEVVNINTTIESSWLKSRFSYLSEKQLKALVRSEDSQLRGDFVVVDVKRWLKTRHIPMSSKDVFEIDTIGSSDISGRGPEIPVEVITEEFEVYIEPFRHTELTETPIAKLRNLLGPMSGYFQMLEIINEMDENDENKAGMYELLSQSAKQSSDTMDKILELVKNQKIWK